MSGEPWTFFRRWSQQGIRVARLYTEISLAMADAAIAAWDAKYYTAIDLWRPVTAIRQALTDGNASTHEDLGWQPLPATAAGVHFTPCFPAWASGHATFAGAWAQVMKHEFAGADLDDPFPLTLTTEDPHSVMDNNLAREFFIFDHAAEENAGSRIFLGVHFRFDAQAGIATGRSVGNHVTGNRLRPIQTCEEWDCEG